MSERLERKPKNIATSIHLKNDVCKYEVIVLIEGKKDYNLYKRFFRDDSKFLLEDCGGKESEKIVFSKYKKDEKQNVIAIFDSDFSRIEKSDEYSNPNFFVTDFHDSEVMMYNSVAFQKMVEFICDTHERDLEFKKIYPNFELFRINIFENAKKIGNLKLANKVHCLGLEFKHKSKKGDKIVPFKKFCSFQNLKCEIDEKSMIKTVYNFRSPDAEKRKSTQTESLAKNKFHEESNKDHDILELVNGHDITLLIHYLFKENKYSSTIIDSTKSLEEFLSGQFLLDHFKETKLYRKLAEYEITENVAIFRE